MSPAKVKVLYIAGFGRSGSTILNNMLGQSPGVFAGGEIHSIWRQLLHKEWLCGCREPLRECPVWSAIFTRAFGGWNGVDPGEVTRERRRGDRLRFMPLMAISGVRNRMISQLQPFRDRLARLYGAIAETTGCDVIVDSSKLPSYGYVLSTLADIELYVVHLVRDARASAFSWKRRKRREDSVTGDHMDRMSSVAASLLWVAQNYGSELLLRPYTQGFIRIRYEDFVKNPYSALKGIGQLLGIDVQGFVPDPEARVNLRVTHAVGGNPTRIKAGSVKLTLDDEWRTGMPYYQRAIVTAFTWPLLLRYGYVAQGNIRW